MPVTIEPAKNNIPSYLNKWRDCSVTLSEWSSHPDIDLESITSKFPLQAIKTFNHSQKLMWEYSYQKYYFNYVQYLCKLDNDSIKSFCTGQIKAITDFIYADTDFSAKYSKIYMIENEIALQNNLLMIGNHKSNINYDFDIHSESCSAHALAIWNFRELLNYLKKNTALHKTINKESRLFIPQFHLFIHSLNNNDGNSIISYFDRLLNLTEDLKIVIPIHSSLISEDYKPEFFNRMIVVLKDFVQKNAGKANLGEHYLIDNNTTIVEFVNNFYDYSNYFIDCKIINEPKKEVEGLLLDSLLSSVSIHFAKLLLQFLDNVRCSDKIEVPDFEKNQVINDNKKVVDFKYIGGDEKLKKFYKDVSGYIHFIESDGFNQLMCILNTGIVSKPVQISCSIEVFAFFIELVTKDKNIKGNLNSFIKEKQPFKSCRGTVISVNSFASALTRFKNNKKGDKKSKRENDSIINIRYQIKSAYKSAYKK